MITNLSVNDLTAQTLDIDTSICTCEYCGSKSPVDFNLTDYEDSPKPNKAFLSDGKSCQEYLIYGFRTLIGRNEGNSIRLNDSGVSRSHAIITSTNNKYYIEDLNSKNGTFVNGKLLKEKYELRPGDSVRMGNSHFEFRVESGSYPVLATVIEFSVHIKQNRMAA